MENRDRLIKEIEGMMDELQWDLEFLSSQALDRTDDLPVTLDDITIEDAKRIIRFVKDMNDNTEKEPNMKQKKRFQIEHFEKLNEIMVSIDLKDVDKNEIVNVTISPPAFEELFEEYGYDKVFTWEIEKEQKKDGVIDCVKFAEFDDCLYPDK